MPSFSHPGQSTWEASRGGAKATSREWRRGASAGAPGGGLSCQQKTTKLPISPHPPFLALPLSSNSWCLHPHCNEIRVSGVQFQEFCLCARHWISSLQILSHMLEAQVAYKVQCIRVPGLQSQFCLLQLMTLGSSFLSVAPRVRWQL